VQKKTRNSRHIPCPDWIQNVTVTCKRSHLKHIEERRKRSLPKQLQMRVQHLSPLTLIHHRTLHTL